MMKTLPLLLLGLAACTEEPAKGCPDGESRAADGLCYPPVDTGLAESAGVSLGQLQTLSPVPAPPDAPGNAVADSDAAAALGRALFEDAGLSAAGDQSCASCHLADHDLGGDGALSSDAESVLARNVPPLVGAAWRPWAGWTGACDSMWCAAAVALEHPGQLDGDRVSLVHLISANDDLKVQYEGIFGPLPSTEGLPLRARPEGELAAAWDAMDSASQEATTAVLVNVAKSWEAWLRQLAPGETALDRYTAALTLGDTSGGGHLSDEAIQGLALFATPGSCIRCHSGPMLAGDAFRRTGLPQGTGPVEEGRPEGLAAVLANPFNGAGAWSDDPDAGQLVLDEAEETGALPGAFRPASLRTLSRTAPYMHDGQLQTLADVVGFYSVLDAEPAVGERDPEMSPLLLGEGEVAALLAFLDAVQAPPSEGLR